MPGNNKNNINVTINFFNKLIDHQLDYVQGSRFLKGGSFKILLLQEFSL